VRTGAATAPTVGQATPTPLPTTRAWWVGMKRLRRRHPVGGPGGIIRCYRRTQEAKPSPGRPAESGLRGGPQETYDLLVVMNSLCMTFGWLSVEDGGVPEGRAWFQHVIITWPRRSAGASSPSRSRHGDGQGESSVRRRGSGAALGSIGDARLPDVFTGTQYQHRKAPKPGRR